MLILVGAIDMNYEQLSTEPLPEHDQRRLRDQDDAELELLEETEGIAGEFASGEAGSYAIPMSKEARKRLWWRNALLNLSFIACWYVFILFCHDLMLLNRSQLIAKVYICNTPICVQ